MERVLAVLEKASDGDPIAANVVHERRVAPPAREIATLMTRVFPDVNPPKIVAFVAVSPGAGVTSTLHALASAVEHERGRRPAIVSAADITSWRRTRAAASIESDGPGSVTAFFSRLLDESDCVFIDCAPIEASTEISRVASVADGVVLVVEAGVTRKTQIERAVTTIKAAKGTCLGVVLNKRRYPIPGWLYRLIG